MLKRLWVGVCLLFLGLLTGEQSAQAQPERHDKEVLFFAGNFVVGVGDNADFDSASIGGRVGYFLTRRNEIGGELDLSFTRFRSSVCTIGSDGSLQCTNNRIRKHFGVGLGAFYRFNFASKGARGFPFIGGSVNDFDLTEAESEGVEFRPEAGYKYFVKKNVAFDLSVGYRINAKFGGRDFIDGRLGLTFLF